jgi:Na+/proline symporter
VIEAINKIGSACYAPVLVTFVIGMATKRVKRPAMIAGVLTGVALNLSILLGNWPIHWMRWNAIGAITTLSVVSVATGLSRESGQAIDDERSPPPVTSNLRHGVLMLGRSFAVTRG